MNAFVASPAAVVRRRLGVLAQDLVCAVEAPHQLHVWVVLGADTGPLDEGHIPALRFELRYERAELRAQRVLAACRAVEQSDGAPWWLIGEGGHYCEEAEEHSIPRSTRRIVRCGQRQLAAVVAMAPGLHTIFREGEATATEHLPF